MKEEPQWQILTFYISLQGRGVGTIQRVCEGSVSLLAGPQRGAVIFASRRAAIKMYGCKWLYMGMYGLNVRATVTSCPWAAHVKTVKEGILGLHVAGRVTRRGRGKLNRSNRLPRSVCSILLSAIPTSKVIGSSITQEYPARSYNFWTPTSKQGSQKSPLKLPLYNSWNLDKNIFSTRKWRLQWKNINFQCSLRYTYE